MVFRALYSMIQFTTVTLLYSFASSLGDFQVIFCEMTVVFWMFVDCSLQFLYIDLFIIIPVAVTSTFANIYEIVSIEFN